MAAARAQSLHTRLGCAVLGFYAIDLGFADKTFAQQLAVALVVALGIVQRHLRLGHLRLRPRHLLLRHAGVYAHDDLALLHLVARAKQDLRDAPTGLRRHSGLALGLHHAFCRTRAGQLLPSDGGYGQRLFAGGGRRRRACRHRCRQGTSQQQCCHAFFSIKKPF